MQCPVCHTDHILTAPEMITGGRGFFSPCPDCLPVDRNKGLPPDDTPANRCRCGKTFLDDVFVSLYHVLVDNDLFAGTEPLRAVGTPLIDPGIPLRSAPFLPPRSLLLVSTAFDTTAAGKAYREVPELSGILAGSETTPGIGDIGRDAGVSWHQHDLLCGCDVRADLFPTSRGPVAVYKKQGSLHIEFARGMDPKIRSVEREVRNVHPSLFVDACAGPGTLGLCSMRIGVPHAILNDPWYMAAFFSGFNLLVNREILGLDECALSTGLTVLASEPVRREPLLVAEGYGKDTDVQVFQGVMECLPPVISSGPVLTAFDPFDKRNFSLNQSFITSWKEKVGGEVFIP